MSNLTVSQQGLEEAKRLLAKIPRRAKSALPWAINRTATHIRTEAAKRIRSELNIKSSKIKEDIRIRRATRSRPIADISARRRGLQLRNFGPRQLTKPGKTVDRRTAGVSVKVKRRGSRKKLRSAFLAPLPNNVTAVAQRFPGDPKQFEVLYGPSVSQAFAQIREELAVDSREFFMRQLRSRVEHELSRTR